MDARDVALQHSAPVVTVPRYGGFTPLAENGHRFLVTGDGLWLEARRPWLYLRVPLVCQKSVPILYGIWRRCDSMAVLMASPCSTWFI